MSSVATKLFIELVVVPVVIELLERRGVVGVGVDHVADPTDTQVGAILELLRSDKSLQEGVIKDVADAADEIASGFVDAAVRLFKAVNRPECDGSDDS